VGTGPGCDTCDTGMAPAGAETMELVGELGVHVPDGTNPGGCIGGCGGGCCCGGGWGCCGG
jgi:hypothetical protein